MAYPGTGTIVNVGTIILGSCLGLSVGRHLPERVSETVLQGLGLVVGLVGLQMAWTAQSAAQLGLVMVSMVLGAVVGEMIDLEKWLTKLGQAIEERFQAVFGPNPIAKAFVISTLLFLVGPMAIVGGIQDGLSSDPSVLLIKAGLDGIASITFAASLGIGTMFSALPLAIYQGGWTILGFLLGDFVPVEAVQALNATGGLVVLGIGTNLLKITQLRLGNFLPALLIAAGIAGIFPIWTLEF